MTRSRPLRPSRAAAKSRPAAARRLRIEALEDRSVPTVFTVTNTHDDGSTGSLRWAINQCNADSDPVSNIDFAIPGSGVHTILIGSSSAYPSQPLPTIVHPVNINGYSQPGASFNTCANDDNAVLQIELNGRGGSSPVGVGLDIAAGNSTVRGLIINGLSTLSNGIFLQGAGGDRIQGNFIGTDASGTAAPYGLPNFGAGGTSPEITNGVYVGESFGFQHDVIGMDGTTDSADPTGWSDLAERNIIAACEDGVRLGGPGPTDISQYFAAQTNNIIAGNFIGTDVHGTTALGNWLGVIMIGGAHDDVIGTTDVNHPERRNIISGNGVLGVLLGGVGGTLNSYRGTVAGNVVGADVNGAALGNLEAGVAVIGGSQSDRIVGNTIAYNGVYSAALNNDLANGSLYATAPGVWIFNLGGAPSGNTIQGNSIYGNAGLGIDLGGSWPPPAADGVNSLSVPDGPGTGPNNLQHYPQLIAAQSGSTTSISGSLNSNNAGPYTLDFYANTTADPSGYGQGRTYLGSASVNTSGSFFVVLPVATSSGEYVTATATDAAGDTSEFSADIQETTNSALLPALMAGGTVAAVAASDAAAQAAIAAVNALPPDQTPSASLDLQLSGKVGQVTVNAPPNLTLYLNGVLTPAGTTLDPAVPALVVNSGNVIVSHVTFTESGDAPTIQVAGGSLTLRNCAIQESTGFGEPAVRVTGGTLDLGTAADPGGNTLNVNGTGTLLDNETAATVSAFGNHWTAGGTAAAPGPLVVGSVVWGAASTVTITGGSFVYDGQSHPAAATVTGTGGVSLGSPAITYAYLDGGGAWVPTANGGTAAPLDPGYYRATAVFGGTDAYQSATATAEVTIAYAIQSLTDLGAAFRAGRTIPIKLQLLDANGLNVSSAGIEVSALRLERVNADGTRTQVSLQDAGGSNPNDLFRYDASLGGYIFNLSTRGLTAGAYEFVWAAGDDPTEHDLQFSLI